PRASSFYASGDRLALHSFPTRRSSDLGVADEDLALRHARRAGDGVGPLRVDGLGGPGLLTRGGVDADQAAVQGTDDDLAVPGGEDRKSTRLNSSHVKISYAVFCLKKKT